MQLYVIKQFINNGVHMGHYKWECDYRLSYFLLGKRNSIHIINVYYTLYILKKLVFLIYNLGILNQKILLVNNFGYEIKFFINNIKTKALWFINKKWIGGLLTNQKHLYFYNEKLFTTFYGLGYSALLPSFVFVSNISRCSSSIYEAIILNIPNSCLLDTNIGVYGAFYGLAGNDDNFIGIKLFLKIFAKTYIKSIYDKMKFIKIKKRKKKKHTKRIYLTIKKENKKTYIKKLRKKKKIEGQIKKKKKRLHVKSKIIKETYATYLYLIKKKKKEKRFRNIKNFL